jgi:dTDP-4-dehydrorhamnose reductase
LLLLHFVGGNTATCIVPEHVSDSGASCIRMQERWRNHVILRSSIIYGAQCSTPVSRMLFLQFIVSSLEAGKPTAFFDDEFRSPIYVQVTSACQCL